MTVIFWHVIPRSLANSTELHSITSLNYN